MTKKLTAITLATSLILGSFYFNNSISHAETKQDLRNIQEQRKDVKEDLSKADKQVTDLMSEIEDLNKEIERVNQSLQEKQETIEETERDIKNSIKDIRILQDEIKELEADIQKRQEILKDRIASYQKSGGSMSYLEVIFGAQSFSDFISRVSLVSTITESDATLIENLKTDIHKVAEKKKLALEKLNELNEMKAKQEETLAQINGEKRKNEQHRVLLEKKQQALIALIGELKSEDKNLASLEKEVKHNIEAQAAEKALRTKREAERKRNETKARSVKEAVAKGNESEEKTQENDDKKTFTVTATAYTLESAGGSGTTYTGIDLKENPNAKVIAVDPSVIPLGSIVHVEGYGYAIAGDIGSAINGNKIDVYVPTEQAAMKWGVRTVKVTIQ
ncbi:PcsB-like coiled-coil domain-containing protein [Virgibacillus oceani]|uniref:Cell wall-binding protein n=1 Tax=Virgibacillus oceani TaxID=1479511 RepID=A0A917M475_9BACI|nr:3D domain-containing protein [Virgibacillus oceani]GGG75940.1 cell wall-binding protein [Virgibacillus oceani]